MENVVCDHKKLQKSLSAAARSCAALVVLFGGLLSIPAMAVPIGVEVTKAPPPDYIFGVFPYLPPRDLEQVFAPIAAEFSRVLGRKVQFTSSSTYEIYSGRLDSEEFDIAFMQPFDYVRAADLHGYLPLAARGEQLKALIVTAPDSPVKNLEDLRGKRISLPPMDSAVSHLVRVYLRKNGLIPDKDVTLAYYRSHISCMQQVLIDASAACGTAMPAFRYFKTRMKVEMRVVLETEAIPHTLFTVHKRVSLQDRTRLLEAITSWGNTAEGKVILERGKMIPFAAITNDAYDAVRKFPRE